jgi:hypothetical protein
LNRSMRLRQLSDMGAIRLCGELDCEALRLVQPNMWKRDAFWCAASHSLRRRRYEQGPARPIFHFFKSFIFIALRDFFEVSLLFAKGRPGCQSSHFAAILIFRGRPLPGTLRIMNFESASCCRALIPVRDHLESWASTKTDSGTTHSGKLHHGSCRKAISRTDWLQYS